jgi:uncharacterized protein (TIGR02996 family)
VTQERDLLWAIADEPDDDGPRLALADWLEEHGRMERAEFIRGQLRLASLHEDSPERRELAFRPGGTRTGVVRAVQPLGRVGLVTRLRRDPQPRCRNPGRVGDSTIRHCDGSSSVNWAAISMPSPPRNRENPCVAPELVGKRLLRLAQRIRLLLAQPHHRRGDRHLNTKSE